MLGEDALSELRSVLDVHQLDISPALRSHSGFAFDRFTPEELDLAEIDFGHEFPLA